MILGLKILSKLARRTQGITVAIVCCRGVRPRDYLMLRMLAWACSLSLEGWHVCRTKLALNICFLRHEFSHERCSEFFSPKILSLYFVGQKKSRKNPAEFPAKFPSPKSKKIHRQASAGAPGEQWCGLLSAPKSQRFLRSAIAMPIADPRNRSDFRDKRKQCCIAI